MERGRADSPERCGSDFAGGSVGFGQALGEINSLSVAVQIGGRVGGNHGIGPWFWPMVKFWLAPLLIAAVALILRLHHLGANIVQSTPQSFLAYNRSESARWKGVIQKIGIHAQ